MAFVSTTLSGCFLGASGARAAVSVRGAVPRSPARRAAVASVKASVDSPVTNSVFAEYIWLGGLAAETVPGKDWPICTDANDIRSKTKILSERPESVAELPEWNYDGSSTGQAPGQDSEVILKPVAMYPDPFRGGDSVLVLCDTWTPQGEPLPSNTRAAAKAIFDKKLDLVPWFGIEQEYTMLDAEDSYPLGWPKSGYPGPQGPYYCGAGATKIVGRDLAEAHARACLHSGLKISGVNAEVMKAQWEYQIGPCVGIESGDEMWISRYLMQRLEEDYNVICSFDPKPISGDWNGAGCHTNFSTEPMRKEGGFKLIVDAVEKLGTKHQEHVDVYGTGNERRLTGAHETAPISEFSWGVADRGCSVRVGRTVEAEDKGYFEDRRPASNIDPYVVTAKIFETTCL